MARGQDGALAAWDGYQADHGEGEPGPGILEYLQLAFKHKWVIAACVAAAPRRRVRRHHPDAAGLHGGGDAADRP
ncbi:MAG: hypothetical protein WDM85_18185 [Caulobacteraceae bacterium]